MRVVIGVLLALTLATAGWGQVISADQVNWQGRVPGLVSGIVAQPAGLRGSVDIYYRVTARYPAGVTTPAGPARATGTVGIAALAAPSAIRISWQAAPGATGYDVIRQPTAAWTGTCVNCVVSSNQAGTTFLDVGGAVVNWPTAGTVAARSGNISAQMNNRDYAFPVLQFTGQIPGSSVLFTSGPVNVGNATPLDLSALTGSQQGIGDRLTGTYGTLTSLKGADFRATSTGGAGTFLVGTQSIATMGAGTVTVAEVMGGNFVASLAAGTATQAYGLIGELDAAAPAAAPTGNFATGILGVLNNSISIQNPTNHPAAVTGAIFDNNAPAEAAVVALLLLDNVRVAPVGAAFKVVDRTIIAGHGFDYGLDLFYHCGAGVCGAAAEDNSFNVADVRLSSQAEILTGTGVPAGGLCAAGNLGSIYINHGGGGGSSLYVCEVAGNWAAK